MKMIDVVFVMMIVCLVMVGMIVTAQFEDLQKSLWTIVRKESWKQQLT